MRRWIHTTTTVDGDPSALADRLQAELPDLLRASGAAGDGDGAVDGSFLTGLPTEVLGLDLAKQVRVRTEVARRSSSRLIIPMGWQAEPAGRAFPVFSGQMELEPLSDRHAQLSLVGSYRVPLGLMGAVADAAVLQHAAQRTAELLLRTVAGRLSGRSGGGDQPAARDRRWPLRVADVMTTDPLTLDPDMPVKTAALVLFHAEISGAPVVAADGELVGVVSERDLLAKVAPLRFGFGRAASDRLRRREARTVGEVCTRPAAVAVPDARLSEAAEELLDRGISRLVVVEGGRVVGIMSLHDVLAALVRDDAEIQSAITSVLDAEGVAHVEVAVVWGTVTLTGTVDRRSQADDVVRSVSGMDGVIDVDADALEWREDDGAPFVPLV